MIIVAKHCLRQAVELHRERQLGLSAMGRRLNEPQGYKYPNRRYLPKAIITIPYKEALDTLLLGPLDS